jgi:predicted DNA-binding transcriptional regulator AlpA
MAVLSSERPPSYVSCATLARELDVSETTVHEMVRRGVLPQPVKLSNGCVRWRWADVDMALGSMSASRATEAASDPFLAGARHATSA